MPTSGLEVALATRFRYAGMLEDVDRAVEVGEEAVEATPRPPQLPVQPGGRPSAAVPGAPGGWRTWTGPLSSPTRRWGSPAGPRRSLCQLPVQPGDRPVYPVPGAPGGWRTWTGPSLSNSGCGAEPHPRSHAEPGHVPLDSGSSLIGGSTAPRCWKTWTCRSRAGGGAGHPPGQADRAGLLNNLGNVLRTRFERTGRVEDLDRAVEVGEEAVDATPRVNRASRKPVRPRGDPGAPVRSHPEAGGPRPGAGGVPGGVGSGVSPS